jgi:hypothetical protein
LILSHRERLILETYLYRLDGLDIEREATPKQLEFIYNTSRRKALIGPRQIGKSYAAGLYLLWACMKEPETLCIFGAKTRRSAKDIIWLLLKKLNRKFNLGAEFYENDLVVRLMNGSEIRVTGLDSNPDDVEKLRGPAYSLMIIDEAGFHMNDLEKLYNNVIKGLLLTKQGTCVFMGTPGYVTHIHNSDGQVVKQFYFQITQEKLPGWEVWHWTPYDNEHTAKQHELERAETIAAMGEDVVNTPWFKREFEGIWLVDNQNKCFQFNELKHVVYLDKMPKQEYLYGMGVDFGWNDPNAFMIGAYGMEDHILYIIDYFKQGKLEPDQVGEAINRFREKYYITGYWCDHKPDLIAHLSSRFGIPLLKADKTEKRHYVELMNGDLQSGRIKIVVLPDLDINKNNPLMIRNHELILEMHNLIWNPNMPGEFHPACSDHCIDSSLYLWRHLFRYRQHPTQNLSDPHSISKQMEKHEKELEIGEREGMLYGFRY